MKIVAEQGTADPTRAEEIAQAFVTKNPDLDGIYVTWAEPARERAGGAARHAGNSAHEDRHARPLRAAGARHGQGRQCRPPSRPTRPIQIGATAARAAALGADRRGSAAFLAADAIAVTKDNAQGRLERLAAPRSAPASLGLK